MSAEENQIALLNITDAPDPRDEHFKTLDIHSYDYYLVMHSAGKDSTASFLWLLEQGIPRSKIEIFHHRVDGAPDEPRVFDWPVTDAYLKAFAKAFDVPLFFSWKISGIAGEMFRHNARTTATSFEIPGGDVITSGGTRGEKRTRRMFPAATANMNTRFCSSYTKIDVGAKAITGQTRFCNKRTMVITGERAEESANRSRLPRAERHRTDRREGKLGRLVDHVRPVIDDTEEQIWDRMKRWGIRPHPAYVSNFSRCSCAYCIFSNPNQLATLREIDPKGFHQMARIEDALQHTMKNGLSLHQVADKGTRYAAATDEAAVHLLSHEYNQTILIDSNDWELPAGAFGENAGPR